MSEAKYIILKEMATKKKFQIAEDYLKKCIVHFAGDSELVGSLILGFSKIVRKYYSDAKGV